MKKRLQFLASMLLTSFILTTVVFWFSENGINKNINSFGDVIWWWVVSSSTVGYGDIVPVSLLGRFAATFAIITGIYLYTNFITISAELIQNQLERHRRGIAKVNHKNHIVICEYTAFADELIQEIDKYPAFTGKHLVIVSDLVDTNPYPQYNFIRGVPINPLFLDMANTKEADYIFIFANARFQEPDLKTLHIVSRIRNINKKAKLYIELKEPDSELAEYLSEYAVIMETKLLLKYVLMDHSLNLHKFESEPTKI